MSTATRNVNAGRRATYIPGLSLPATILGGLGWLAFALMGLLWLIGWIDGTGIAHSRELLPW